MQASLPPCCPLCCPIPGTPYKPAAFGTLLPPVDGRPPIAKTFAALQTSLNDDSATLTGLCPVLVRHLIQKHEVTASVTEAAWFRTKTEQALRSQHGSCGIILKLQTQQSTRHKIRQITSENRHSARNAGRTLSHASLACIRCSEGGLSACALKEIDCCRSTLQHHCIE